MNKGIEIFICYAREDEALCQNLEKQLRALKSQGLIDIWYDRLISAGAEWEGEIDKHLNAAQIILLLVSPDFMASDYCYSTEMKRAVERHNKKEAQVIPVILRPTLWQGGLLGKLQALPTDAIPVVSGKWHSQDEAFFNVAEGIKKVAEELIALVPKKIIQPPPPFALQPSRTNHVGQQLGNYQLIRLLGRGGFAEVYLGEHRYLKTYAAIKLLLAHLSQEDVQGFLQEAQTLARLDHPHIVRIHDFGIDSVPEEIPYLVMSYAPHGSLRKRYPKGSMLPLPLVVSYVNQVAAALQHAHEHKLIHCDVKPENMLLGEKQEVLLSDFGITVMAHSTISLKTQNYAGTAYYSAPEQIRGKPLPASDQYALGTLVYEWLTGTTPFNGSSPIEIAMHQLSDPPPSLREKVPSISSSIEQVVLKSLAKDPRSRFPTVEAFAYALEQSTYQTAPVYPSVENPQKGQDGQSSSSLIEGTISSSPLDISTGKQIQAQQLQPQYPQGAYRPPLMMNQSPMVLLCPLCMAMAPVGTSFCRSCGTNLAGIVPTPANVPIQDQQQDMMQRNTGKYAMGALGGAAVVLGGEALLYNVENSIEEVDEAIDTSKEDNSTGDNYEAIGICLGIGAALFQAIIVPGILGFLLHSGWAFTGFFLGQVVLTGLLLALTWYLSSELYWDVDILGPILIALPSGLTSGAFGWFLVSNFFHIGWLSILVGVVFGIVTMIIIGVVASAATEDW